MDPHALSRRVRLALPLGAVWLLVLGVPPGLRSQAALDPGWLGLEGMAAEAGPPRPEPASETRVREALRAALRGQPHPPRADRHELRARLALDDAGATAPTLVIAFEGTGAFEPQLTPALLSLRSLGPLPPDLQLDDLVAEAFQELHGHKPRWSGLRTGPLTALLRNPEVLPGGYLWAGFPSEEFEVLADDEDLLAPGTYVEMMRDAATSAAVVPRGQIEAVEFTRGFLTRAQAAGLAPRLVVVAHSSGGRTAVKFLENLRRLPDPRTGKAPTTADLVFTIDPVREAHEAVGELFRASLRRGPEPATVGDGDELDPATIPVVAHRPQPESLYKTSNARRWVSVFQRVDTRGLKIAGLRRHGIHGSPVQGADLEEQITLDTPARRSSGHGSIAYAERTVELWLQELRALGRPPPVRAPPPPSRHQRARGFYQSFLRTPHRAWLEQPFWEDLTQANHFAEALVAGATADPEGYQAFRLEVHAADRKGEPVVDWFRSSWNSYLRLFQARYHGGSRAGLTQRRQRGSSSLLLRGRPMASWRSEAETNMKKLSKAMRAAL